MDGFASGGQPVVHAYRLTRADVAAYEALPREFQGRAKLLLVLSLVAMGLPLATLADAVGLNVHAWDVWQEMVAVVVLVLVWTAAVSLVLTLARRRRVARYALPAGETRITADSAGLRVDEDEVTMRHSWSDVAAVTPGRAHVFFDVAQARPVIVPLRAFGDADEMARFAASADAAAAAAVA
jgi:hypothetical protein